jgi:Outer membrane cytochrome MtrC/MtrF-like, domains II/IV
MNSPSQQEIQMERKKGIWFKPLLVVSLLAVLALAGCADDGSQGLQGLPGDQGAPGEPGAPGPVTTTNESCAVCHLEGKIADATDKATGSHYTPAYPQASVIVNSITVDTTTDPAVPTIVTTITPVDDAAADLYAADAAAHATYTGTGLVAVNGSNLAYLRFAYARLNANSQWVRYSSGDRTASHLTDNLDGTYTMRTAVALLDYDATMPTRLLLLVSRITDTAAPNNIISDFVPDGSVSAISRDVVTENACNSCHGNLDNPYGGVSGIHGSARYKVAACVVCHAPRANSASGTQGISVGREMAYFIHAIHSAADLGTPDPDTNVDPAGSDNWSEVTYPENIKNCQKCHTGVADADNYLNASRLACNGCHTGVDFTTGTGHDGGIQLNDNSCAVCHPTSGNGFGQSVAGAHDITPTGANVPEFVVNLALSTPANAGGYYEAGEVVTATVTLTQGGVAVDPALYTAAADTKGVAGGGLNVASIYLYGPRTKAVPLTGTQANSLFAAGTTDGFVYQFTVPADATSGTYMARVRIADYGYVSSSDYVVDSIAFTTFQIGTATVEAKVAGDSCAGCHGDGTAPFHDARHVVIWDTDHCLACHDQSGGHADTITNRVHAIHSTNSTGDFTNYDADGNLVDPLARDWAEVTFPQNVKRCVACHSSGSKYYQVTPYSAPCAGCHVGADNVTGTPYVIDHLRQNGGPL